MEPARAALLAHQLLRTHNLPSWSFAFNRRKRALGLCRYDLQRIELSLPFTLANDEPAILDTLLHEIAHALAGRDAHHGRLWKQTCLRLGCRPERCDRTAVMPKGKYQALCPHCAREYSRHRRPLRSRTYYCRHCGPDLGPIRFTRLLPTQTLAA